MYGTYGCLVFGFILLLLFGLKYNYRPEIFTEYQCKTYPGVKNTLAFYLILCGYNYFSRVEIFEHFTRDTSCTKR